jgi:hypothetical protein
MFSIWNNRRKKYYVIRSRRSMFTKGLVFYVPEEELDNLWSKLNMDRDVGLDYLDFRRIMKRGSASFLN